MCFSAEVSFGASAVLAVSGVIAVKKTTARNQIWFACIPFIFSVQQFSEGIVWLTYMRENMEIYRHLASGIFLAFAQVIWPFWVPFAMLKLEGDHKMRRNLLKLFLVMGSMLSVYVIYCLCFFPFNAYPDSHHLKYELGFPLAHSLFAALFYFVPTVLSCIVSSRKGMTTLGIIILLSYVAASIFFHEYSLSVWCFFSAIISVGVIYIVHLMKPASAIGYTNRSTHAMEG